MANASSKIKCPGCGLSQTVGFRMPKLFSLSLVQYVCRDCGSDVFAKITKPQRKDDPDGNRVRIQAKITKASDLLTQMRAEEKNKNEDNDAAL